MTGLLIVAIVLLNIAAFCVLMVVLAAPPPRPRGHEATTIVTIDDLPRIPRHPDEGTRP